MASIVSLGYMISLEVLFLATNLTSLKPSLLALGPVNWLKVGPITSWMRSAPC